VKLAVLENLIREAFDNGFFEEVTEDIINDDKEFNHLLRAFVSELRKKRVVRGKKLYKKTVCPTNKRYVPALKKCVVKTAGEKLNEAPISSPSQMGFSTPEAQKQVEQDIIKMGKILGKASQQVVKTMMDGVKSKKYDAFDLQRAIMTGPVRDTGTGQRTLMRALWGRVRDGFRRYSKRGKLR
jgi:hypothetical protein